MRRCSCKSLRKLQTTHGRLSPSSNGELRPKTTRFCLPCPKPTISSALYSGCYRNHAPKRERNPQILDNSSRIFYYAIVLTKVPPPNFVCSFGRSKKVRLSRNDSLRQIHGKGPGGPTGGSGTRRAFRPAAD